jgi:hypothetical protein
MRASELLPYSLNSSPSVQRRRKSRRWTPSINTPISIIPLKEGNTLEMLVRSDRLVVGAVEGYGDEEDYLDGGGGVLADVMGEDDFADAVGERGCSEDDLGAGASGDVVGGQDESCEEGCGWKM